MGSHLLIIGGEDHDLRLPFMVRLKARGYKVTAAGTGSSIPFEQENIPFFPFSFQRYVHPLKDIEALASIRGLVESIDPDIVQCFDTKLNILVPLALRNAPHRPVVRTINGRGWLYSSTTPYAMALRVVYRVLHRLAARTTRAEVFEHEEDRDFFERHGMVGSGGSVIIPGAGIDVDGFEQARATAARPEQLRAQLGLGDAPVVMTVTRMTRQKGIGTLLRAAAEIHARHPQVRFVLVGPRESEGPLAISQAAIDAHAPYVIATGPRADVPALLGIADVFAFPTEYREGIPRALCEAALAGVPIVTTSMPGCCRVVRDGWNGLVVPPHNAARLAASIMDLLEDRERALMLAARGAAPVRHNLSLDAIAAGYAKLYDKVARREDLRPLRQFAYEQSA